MIAVRAAPIIKRAPGRVARGSRVELTENNNDFILFARRAVLDLLILIDGHTLALLSAEAGVILG